MSFDAQNLVRQALEARKHAYAPYSAFTVGAALLCADGTIYHGANLENASYSATICAERTAFFKAAYDGHRDFCAIAIVGGPADEPISDICAPCGMCRQVMREWCDPDTFRIILAADAKHPEEHTLAELLPLSFGPSNLGK